MGIVFKQSLINTLVIFLGFAIGGINVLFLFTHFLQDDYFGLVTFLLSTANILLPLLVFGMQHTIIKFFSSYNSKKEQDEFLSVALFIPLLIIIPTALVGILAYEELTEWLSVKNKLIKNYTYLIFIIAIFMGYFELFYAWSKVHLKSVFGNFLKEVFARISTFVLLFSVYFGWITEEQFIYAIAVVYGVRMLLMKLYAFYIYFPKLSFKLPSNIKSVLSFSIYIIVAGSATGILLEIDKFMIPRMEKIVEVAYYSVGIYIASVIAIPSRAMQQITSPITAKEMNGNNIVEVEKLYKQSSINLLVVGGLLFLLINLNITDLYAVINKPQFTKGIAVVFIISIVKLMELALGTGNAILTNSKYYKVIFYLSIAMAISVIILNRWLITLMGINGAAIATLIVVIVYSMIKLLYIKMKLKIQPFNKQTLKIIGVLSIIFGSFYFWNFSFHPLVNILIKTVLISVSYILLVKKLAISAEISTLLNINVKNKNE
ncbi:oligosaccharide flippase family protein [Lutibacter sp.]